MLIYLLKYIVPPPRKILSRGKIKNFLLFTELYNKSYKNFNKNAKNA